MKKLLFLLLIIASTSTFAMEETFLETEFESEILTSVIEYKLITDEFGFDTCYARFCWNTSETSRRCTEWQEVPCANPTLEVESESESLR